jgi:hypothetical protein
MKCLKRKPKQDKASWKKRAAARQTKQDAFKSNKQKISDALTAQVADDVATLNRNI